MLWISSALGAKLVWVLTASISFILDRCTVIVEISPESTKFLKNNLFVNLKLVTHCIQPLCRKQTLFTDMLVFGKISDVLHSLRDGNGRKAKGNNVSHYRRFSPAVKRNWLLT
jgi:hypothetical protein